jgi:hypothetical protein
MDLEPVNDKAFEASNSTKLIARQTGLVDWVI